MTLADAVAGSLAGLALQSCDHAAAELAMVYALRIDDGEPVEKLGPPLLAALEALGMTPRARAALVRKGESDVPQRSPLDELRARREQRATG